MIAAYATFVSTVFFTLALVFASPSDLASQSEKYSDQDLAGVLQPTDKAYSVAMELAQTLRARHFTIKCVLRSKRGSSFEGLEGAALFRTSRGDFEAIFLPKQKTFARLRVLERQENGWYIYSFKGDPKPWPANRIESPRPIYFVKHSHTLLETTDDVLAENLRRAVSGH